MFWDDWFQGSETQTIEKKEPPKHEWLKWALGAGRWALRLGRP